MRLVFFKRTPADSAIEVAATPANTSTANAASIKAVAHRVMPDLGDYTAEFPEALPESLRFLPYVTWALLLSFVTTYAWFYSQESALARSARRAAADSKAAEMRGKSLDNEMLGVSAKDSDLYALIRWVQLSHPVRGVLVETLTTAVDKVQLRSLDVKRIDPNLLRYSVALTCSGTKTNFDRMRGELVERLTKLGWQVTENEAAQDDTRLVFDATISRKQG